ncbi:TPA: DUF4145 domain-containing protein [Vibrio parahaemolyticus]
MAFFHFLDNVPCPKCNHNANFDLLYASPHRESRETNEGTRWSESSSLFHGLFTCTQCGNPLSMDISLKKNGNTPLLACLFLNRLNFQIINSAQGSTKKNFSSYELKMDKLGHNLRQYFQVEEIYSEVNQSIPSHLPSKIEKMIKDDVLQVMGSPKYLVIACRALLETSCKDLLENPTGKLVSMINQLSEQGHITKSVADWAHTIRKIANESVHTDESPTPEEAREVYDFTLTILELLYSYPARVKKLRMS